MPAFLIPLAVGVAQMGYGHYQQSKAKKQLESLTRPSYEIPEEISQNLSMAQRRALEGLPEEQRKLYIENIQRGRNTAVSNLQDRRSGGVSDIYQTEVDAMKDLLAMDVGARRQNEGQLTQQNMIMAQQKQQQFEANQMQPYRQAYNEARSLQGAGIQNVMGGVNTSMGAASMLQQNEILEKYGKAMAPTAPVTPFPAYGANYTSRAAPNPQIYPAAQSQPSGMYPTAPQNNGMYPTSPAAPGSNPYSFGNTNQWMDTTPAPNSGTYPTPPTPNPTPWLLPGN